MKTIHATYEGGVFRPKEALDLPENCEVEFELRAVKPAPRKHQDRVYAILSESFDTDNPKLAERHDEHQP